MDLAQFLNGMRDPSGVPFFPVVFQFLMVLTFTLHIVCVNVVVGGLAISIWEAWKGGPYGRRLARGLAKASTIILSVAIVLGVAPLLFVQVIYDPFWYASNTMSAIWAMLFLVWVCTAFYAAYGFYLGNKKGDSYGELKLFWAYVALGAMVLAGITIHTLTMEALLPDMWHKWLIDGNGALLTGGARFHGMALGRLLHFFMASFAVTGVYMILYAWYFSPRPDMEPEYLAFVAKKGVNIALYGTLLAAATGFWWAGEVPESLGFLSNPVFLLSVLAAVIFILYLANSQNDPANHAIPITVLLLITVFVMSYAREILRMKYVGAFDYSIFAYKLNISWGSTLLFFATFVLGLVVLYFPLLCAYKTGRTEPGKVVVIPEKVGSLANILLVGWFIVVAGLGIIISFKNGTLP